MRQPFILLSCLLLSLAASAQRENWMLSAGDGLAFENGNATCTKFTDNWPGGDNLASIWDNDGKLVLYTNGMKVWDGNHRTITNGDDLLTGSYCYDPIIVRAPGFTDKYYIFCRYGGLIAAFVEFDGTAYRVTWKGKKIAPELDVVDLLVTSHCDNESIWLLARTVKDKGNFLYAFKISRMGIESPVGSVLCEERDVWGWSISPDGSRLGISLTTDLQDPPQIQLADFDKETGAATPGKIFNTPAQDFYSYRLCFSENSSKLYGLLVDAEPDANYNWYYIYQFDLQAADISASAHRLFGDNAYTLRLWDLQIGPGGAIYVSMGIREANGDYSRYNNFINVIKSPNEKGVACNYMHRICDLPKIRQVARFPILLFDHKTIGKINADIAVNGHCSKSISSFSIQSSFRISSAQWDFGNPASGTLNSSDELQPGHTYVSPRKYTVRAIIHSCGLTDTIYIEVEITEPPKVELGTDTIVCKGTPVIINAGTGSAFYRWDDGSTDSLRTVTAAGLYRVSVTKNGCNSIDSIRISDYPDVWVSLGDEYFICEDISKLARLDAGKGFAEYRWYPTQDTTQWIDVAKTGDYYVIVKDFRGCSGRDETVVHRRCPGSLYFPNSFTPNGDGTNDTYVPAGQDILTFQMKIYNRWGELLFESNTLNNGWDGHYKNAKCPQDTYLGISEYSTYSSNLRSIEKKYEKRFIYLLK